jgi:integrase
MRGTLKQRAKGTWTIILDAGRDPATGRRRQQWHTVRGTKKQAEARLTELLHQVDQGGYIKPVNLTVGAFLGQWLRDYVVTNVRARTEEGYRDIIIGHLIPGMGNIPLAQLNGAHLQEYYARALSNGRKDGEGGLSPRSVLHHHRVLREALSHAVKWQLVSRNVADAVDPPRPEKVEMTALDNSGLLRLLDAARATMYFPLLHLVAYTGLRRSEALALRWQDIDLDLATLAVVRSVHRVRGKGMVFTPPKTARSRRQVALSPSAALALRAHRDQQQALWADIGTPAGDMVFCRIDGSPLRPDTVTHAFADLVKKAGIPHVRLHDLRHTHATLMMEQGVNPKVVSERLGHSSVGITLDLYSHVSPTLQADAALRFDRAMVDRAKEPVTR